MSWLISFRTAKTPAAPTAPAAASAAACLYCFFFVSSIAAKAPPTAIKAQRVISANKAYLANTDNVAPHAVLLALADRVIALIVRITLKSNSNQKANGASDLQPKAMPVHAHEMMLADVTVISALLSYTTILRL